MPKYINSDDFLIQMQMLYKEAGWEKRDVHFSLADLECNIAMMPAAALPSCIKCKYYPNNPRHYYDNDIIESYVQCGKMGDDGYCSKWRDINDLDL